MKKEKNNELITIKEAAILANISETKIRDLIKKGILSFKKDGVMKVYKKELLEYIARIENDAPAFSKKFEKVACDWDESYKVLYSFSNPNYYGNPDKYTSHVMYLVSNKGKIVNAKHSHLLKITTCTNGYSQIRIRQNKKDVSVDVHRIVAIMWCPNGKLKQHVHHIDCRKGNNTAANLIWMTPEEHHYAHELINNNDKKAYKKYISEIKKDNKITEELRVIINPEISQNERAIHYIFITKTAYERYIATGDWNSVLTSEIRGEYVGRNYGGGKK